MGAPSSVAQVGHCMRRNAAQGCLNVSWTSPEALWQNSVCMSCASTFGFKGSMATKLSWFSFIAFVIIKLLWNGLSEPLTEVHWDSVVHLEHAKQFADTAFIKNHAQQASAIAA